MSKSKGVPAPTPKQISMQKLVPGQRAEMGTSSMDAYVGRYGKTPSAVSTPDYLEMAGMGAPPSDA